MAFAARHVVAVHRQLFCVIRGLFSRFCHSRDKENEKVYRKFSPRHKPQSPGNSLHITFRNFTDSY
jgi:hypothetical protein